MGEWARIDTSHNLKRMAMHKNGLGHHEAVCLDNKNRVELRIFKSTTDPETFWNSMEFTHALCMYARVAPLNKMRSASFKKWVDGENYPHLNKMLKETAVCA